MLFLLRVCLQQSVNPFKSDVFFLYKANRAIYLYRTIKTSNLNLIEMKKIILFLAAAMFVVSCSSSDNNLDPNPPGPPNPPSPPSVEAKALPLKVVMETEKNGVVTYTISYVADTQKINKITITGTDRNNEERYTYKGDLIDKIEYGSNGDYTQYEYQNDALVRETSYRNNELVQKQEYEYQTNQSLKQKEYEYQNGEWLLKGNILANFDNNGNLVGGTVDFGDKGNLQLTATYDNKNTPVANITGWSKVQLLGGIPLGDNIDFVDIAGRRNNPEKVLAIMNEENINITYSYEFKDEKNPQFPTKVIGKLNNVILFTAEISY